MANQTQGMGDRMRYDQPFCTRGSKGQFWHGYMESGYCPPIEQPEDRIYQEEIKPIKITPQTGIITYLESKVKDLLSLKEKLEAHITQGVTSKKKSYKYG